MQVTIHSLIDITETNARKGSDRKIYSQQQNYMTLMQTIGLRSNYEIDIPVYMHQVKIDGKFGSNYTGEQNVWSIQLNYQSNDDVDVLRNDLNLVPIIVGLDETSIQDANVFRTTDPIHKNLLVKVVDNTIL